MRLYQFDLNLAGLRWSDREFRLFKRFPIVSELERRHLFPIEPRPDTEISDPVPHRFLNVTNDVADLPHAVETLNQRSFPNSVLKADERSI
jgi:hypothetical protein